MNLLFRYTVRKNNELLGFSLSRQRYRSGRWLSIGTGFLMCGTLKTGTAETKFMNEGKSHDHVLKEPGRKNSSDSFMWFYCSIKEAENMSDTLNTNRGTAGNIRNLFWKAARDISLRMCSRKTFMTRKLQTRRSSPAAE